MDAKFKCVIRKSGSTGNFPLKFPQIALQVPKGTPNPMVYGELGRLEIRYQVCHRMIGFWKRLTSSLTKYSNLLYNCINPCGKTDIWLEGIQKNLIECCVPAIFENPAEISEPHMMSLESTNGRRWYSILANVLEREHSL